MIEYREIPDTSIVEFTVDGKITAEEFDSLVERFEAFIERHGKVQVLEHVKSFGGMPLSKWWEDFKFGMRHWRDVTRAAVVADKKWVEIWTKVVRPFVSCEVRFFDSSEMEDARSWLREA